MGDATTTLTDAATEELPQNMDEESHKYDAYPTIFVDRRVAVLSGT